MTAFLRTVAIAIALVAFIDPAIAVERSMPIRVALHLDEHDPDAVDVRSRLQTLLGDDVNVNGGDEAAAVIVIGHSAEPEVFGGAAPVSTVALTSAPNVSIVEAPASITLRSGQAADLRLQLEGRGVAGAASTVILEERGVELARTEHRWNADGRVTVTLPHVAIVRGVSTLTARVVPLPDEKRTFDNRASVRVLADDGASRVAIVEPRPSWPASFVRRALETDPTFDLASVVRVSRGIVSRAGSTPQGLTADQLARFDVVIVGAPEELRSAEVRALREFASVRGGTVILLPDRRPSGDYVELLPGTFSEQLLAEPRALANGLRGSEVVTLRAVGLSPLAALDGRETVIGSWPVGDGRILFSGALDSWRFRGDANGAFARFWRETVEAAALAAPPRVRVTLEPAVVRPHQLSRLTVRLRRSEFEQTPGVIHLPAVAARLIDPGGRAGMIRLWPAAEPGVFEADVAAVDAGLHDVRVRSDLGAAADTTLVVEPEASQAVAPVLESLAALSGGVAVAADNLDPLIEYLGSIENERRRIVTHPFRSTWWMVPFAGVLGAEWMLRRRAGLR